MKRTIRNLVFVTVSMVLILAVVTARQPYDGMRAETDGGRETAAVMQSPTVTVSPDLPFLVTQTARAGFDAFSWQCFIAMNWPAKVDPSTGLPIRGVPDTSKSLGDTSVPRVWESWKADYELFQDQGAPPSAWSSYDTVNPPCATATPGETTAMRLKVLPLAAKGGAMLPGSVNQAMGGPLIGQNGLPVRYEIHLNQTYYEWVSTHNLYLQQNLPQFPNPAVNFPLSTGSSYGAIELKAAWREFTTVEQNNPAIMNRYYWVKAVVIDPVTRACRPAVLGLVGFHIAYKTGRQVSPTNIFEFKEWLWATFEHVDNVPETSPPPPPPPGGYSFNDGTNNPAKPTLKGYWPANAWKPFDPTKPFPTTPNQVVRVNAVPPPTQALNAQVQGMPGIKNTVWQFYQLINTQWPTTGDPIAINDPSTNRDAYPAGCGTPTPAPPVDPPPIATPSEGVANITMETYFQKPGIFRLFGTSCMHCHYQAAQTDFSWVLVDAAWPRNRAAGVPSPPQRRLARFPTAPPTPTRTSTRARRSHP